MKRILFLLTILSGVLSAYAIKSDDLYETGPMQRRDLSVPYSRMVINPYDFKQKPAEMSAAEYSNAPNMPLNVAYLNAHNAVHKTENRYGRQYKNVLTIYHKSQNGSYEEAQNYSTVWLPYMLPFEASYPNGTSISGEDLFLNESSLIRGLSLNRDEEYMICGYLKGKAAVEKNTLYVETPNCKYAIAFKGLSSKSVIFYDSEEDIATGTPARDPESARWWGVKVKNRETLNVGVSFDLLSTDKKTTINHALAASKANVKKVIANNRAYWDNFLTEKVPHPLNFDLCNVPDKGVKPEEIEKSYYKAWVMLNQTSLMPEPGVFDYYQMVTGKASLWDEGEASAPFSATWESLISIQLYAYIDSNVSWSALKGLMSLVDETGMLGGESLPSRKAHTAWVLYSLTGDKESLAEVYPALTRYLNWRMKQPRWIYFGATPENEKDAEFVVSLMKDMEYMINIAEVLGKTDDVELWKKNRKEYYPNYINWFWPSPEEMPIQHINHYKGRSTKPIQITQGLIMDELEGDYLMSLMGVFYKYYDVNKSFAGFYYPKYPDVDFTIYGLMYKKKPRLARGLLECMLRDIVRTGPFFAENYTIDDNPLPEGVRPSTFGVSSIIDFVLLKNGYMFTRGVPHVVNLFPEKGGVQNLPYKGKKINIEVNNRPGVVEVSGSAFANPKEYTVDTYESVPLF